jgi:hypothetical protein
MCGYSISWYPVANRSPPVAEAVTTARSVYSPLLTCGGAETMKRAESDSSSRVKPIVAVGGVAFQPAGNWSATTASAAPFVPLVTATWISRSSGVAASPPAAGTTASAGVTRTENAGTTFSSIRLSPW